MKTVEDIRKDFPILSQVVNGKPVAYLDNAATTQKPEVVLKAMDDFYRTTNANVHRGIYKFAEVATALYEGAREKVQEFVKARNTKEIIFTRGATEAFNLLAYTWGEANVGAVDTIVVTEMEHHSNLVPWQQLAKRKGAKLLFVGVTDDGRLDMASWKAALEQKPKIVSFSAFSNVTGVMNPVKALMKDVHVAGAVGVVDAAQAGAHMPIDVQSWNCDFLALAAHKMYGPTGVGVLYGKEEHLAAMPPFLFGGDMILQVSKEDSTWNELPYKFEAGTPNIAGVIGFGTAIDYIMNVGWDMIAKHELELTEHGLKVLAGIKGVCVIGPKTAENRGGVFSFSIDGIHPHDIATIFDSEGIAIRSGHHCAQVLMNRFGVPATARASVGMYTTTDELDRLPAAIAACRKILGS